MNFNHNELRRLMMTGNLDPDVLIAIIEQGIDIELMNYQLIDPSLTTARYESEKKICQGRTLLSMLRVSTMRPKF